jgi:hypothetical protein
MSATGVVRVDHFRMARQPPTIVTWAELHFYDLPLSPMVARLVRDPVEDEGWLFELFLLM